LEKSENFDDSMVI